ncbi:hypothetical protein WN944_017598 [Citrus x changshan-huyou]|uniref:Uncharacterized protein n=1 Tax=Citrus x changshan-huyou TaxID=2935761 RepID=A0AAP0MBK6_9ROSI
MVISLMDGCPCFLQDNAETGFCSLSLLDLCGHGSTVSSKKLQVVVDLVIYRRIDGNSKKGEEAESLVGVETKTKL